MRVLGWLAAGSALMVGFACGGNVVVDSTSDNGVGGAGAATSSTTSGTGGAGAACPVPTPVGVASFCGGSTTGVGAGGPTECDTFFCDAGGNIYESRCSGSTCVCAFNSKTLCTCAVAGGDVCTGGGQPCCPFPFAR
jgi:hypothetical protein